MPTKIPWTDVSWNPVVGCTKVSPGCDNCYAEAITKRFHRGDFNQVALHIKRLGHPFRWRKPRKIFVCSVSDLFHSRVPFDYINKVFCVMGANPRHIYQLLTKRPGRLAYFANIYHPPLWDDRGTTWGAQWPSNIWAGTSVETQKYAPRLDVLARVPAKVRFVSVEPMLEPVDLRKWLGGCECLPYVGMARPDKVCEDYWANDVHEDDTCSCGGMKAEPTINWTICGGESGPHARPMKIEWLLDLVAQCKEAGVPVFVKQDSGRLPGKQGRIPDDIWALKEFPS
ncbi:MAG: phage Gp37/Gp68 family protein [Candidatus Brocadiales bacterium]